jgi:hypothetical protein
LALSSLYRHCLGYFQMRANYPVAIVVGLLLGKLLGFMTAEFVMRPLILVGRWGGAVLLGAIVGWGRRLP